jgi:hypothetical protein
MTPTTAGRRFAHVLVLTLAALAPACGGEPTDAGDGGTVAFLGLAISPDSGKLFVTQSGYVTAQPFDHNHHLITGVSVSWASSDTNVAQIYPAGDVSVGVFAKAPGAAIISASSGDAHASATFAVRLVPLGSVQVTPDSSAAYAGSSTTLAATVTDTFGGVLTDRQVIWSSTNPARAAVNADGVVTGLSAGAVIIIVTCEGKADSAWLTLLDRPTADWSAVTEDWGTFQGNAAHTGYVPAVLDPGVFAKRWEAMIGTTTYGLNQAAGGGGRVFATNSAYFGEQHLVTLDAVTGTELWSQNFGEIHSVDPPAYADGRVYVATGGHEDSFIRAYDAATGAELFSTSYENQWSRWQAPVVSGGSVYMAGGYYGGMYSFDAAGAERWFNQLGQYEGFTPAVAAGRVYALTGEINPQILVVDAATGARVDSLNDATLTTMSYAPGGTPVLGSAHNLLTVQANRLFSFDLQSHGTAWRISGSYIGQPAVANGVVYVQNGGDVEARAESNGALLWSWLRPEQPPLWPNMIVTNNLLFASDGATTYAADLDAHRQVWAYPAGGELSLSKDGLLLIARPDGVLEAITAK